MNVRCILKLECLNAAFGFGSSEEEVRFFLYCYVLVSYQSIRMTLFTNDHAESREFRRHSFSYISG